MIKELRQPISVKETLVFCLLSGAFIYFVTWIPKILSYSFLPPPSAGMDICLYTPPPVWFNPFLVGFGISMLLGICFVRKVNFTNRITHYSILALILSIVSGLTAGIFEFCYFLFHQENRVEVLEYFPSVLTWSVVFLLSIIPFTALFLVATSLINKFSKQIELR